VRRKMALQERERRPRVPMKARGQAQRNPPMESTAESAA